MPWAMAQEGRSREVPAVQAGVLDLGAWTFERDGSVLLAGKWAFSWEAFDPPQLLANQTSLGVPIDVPGAWHGLTVGDTSLGSSGFGTYRLQILCQSAKGLSFFVPNQHSAMRLYVNGREVAHQGVPGISASDTQPAIGQQYVPLGDAACPLQVVAHVSNFDHRRGGLVRAIELGTTAQLQKRHEWGLVRDTSALAGVVLMGVLPILFFIWRRKEPAPLYLGLYCLSTGMVIALSGERLLLPVIASWGWDAYLKLLFANLCAGVALFAMFVHALYPVEFRDRPRRAVQWVAAAAVAVVLLTPARVFTTMVPGLIFSAALVGAYLGYVLIKAGAKGRLSPFVLLGGFVAMAVAVAHDVAYFRTLQAGYWTPFGFLIFALAPGITLARRMSRALAAEELRSIEQRERTNLLVRATKAGLLDWDAIANEVSYSDRYKEMLGYPADTLVSALPAFNDLVHPDEREHVRQSFLEELRDRSVRSTTRHHRSLEYRMRRTDGEYIWVHAEGIALIGHDGKTLRFICSFIDISESKRHEIAVSNQAKFIADLFDTVPIGMALRGTDSRYLFVNKTWEQYVGVKREEVIGKTLRERAPASEVELVEALDRAALALGPGATLGPRENTFRGRRYAQSRTVMADSQGKIIGVLVASIDMHEKHLAEKALAVERDRLQLLVRATKAGFGDWDAQKDEVSYSRRFKEMLGYSGDADTSAWPSIFDMMHPEDREQSREQFRKMISRKKSPGTEQEPGTPMAYRLRRADGSYIWIHAEGIAQVDDQGRTQRFITSYLDVTAFHEQEEALHAQVALTRTEQRRLDLVVRGARVGIVDWDGTTHETYYSPRFREIRGYALDADTTGWPDYFKAMIHPDDRERVIRRWVPFIKGKGPEGPHGEFYSPDEYRLLRADGSSAWVQVSGIAVRDEAGFVLRWIAAIIDVSERRSQEEALLVSHAQLADRMKFVNDLVDALPLALSMRDPSGRYVFANRTWERYYGQRREDAIGRGAAETFPADEAMRVEALDAAALQRAIDGPLYTDDVHFLGREYTEMRTVMLNARHEAVGVVVAAQDVTERRGTERALATEQKRIELVVRAAKAGIVDFDAIERTGYYSPRLREILGYAPDADTSGWPDYFDMIHPDDKARVASEFRKHIVAKREPGAMAYHDRIDYRLHCADGSWVWVQGMGVSITNDKGLTAQFIASITDISERRQQEEKLHAQALLLEQQNEALKENVRLREEVERIARHDIKTPLNSIIAVPRLLREERRLTREADELLGIVERAGYRILSMVNLSLDLYKMEQGSYIFRPDAVDLVDLFDKVAVDIHSHAASKNVSLRVKSSASRACAWAEELLCYSLIANLLKNAVEASPEGAVVTVSIEALEGTGNVALHIHNVGLVPASVRENFFVKYATAGKASGTGLGTYSARLMARVQDGDVTMRTSAAEGTTLSVTLRAAPVGKVPALLRHASERRDDPQPPAMASLPALKVLLVDDDEFNLLIVRRFLPTPPLKVFTAFNGRVALEVAEEETPDVVFMDLDMPIMGGLEAIGKLREQELANRQQRCFAVVLSSHDDEETRARCLASGFDHYLTKPVTRDLIQKTLMDRGAALQRSVSPGQHDSPLAVPATVEIDADLADLMSGFLASRHQLLDTMDQALAAADREGLRRAAHQLAGSLAVYGFHWAADIAKRVEGEAQSLAVDQARTLVQTVRLHLQTASIVVRPE